MRLRVRPSPLVLVVLLAGCSSHWEAEGSGNADYFPPQVYLTDPDLGSTWTTDDAIRVRATIVDDADDAEALRVEIRSDREGVLATPILTPEGQLDTTVTLGEGTHVLTVSAVDSLDLEGTDETTFRVVDVSSPTQPVAALTPEAPVTGDTLLATIAVESVDPEGDPLDYVWSWTVDGQDAGISEATVDGAQVVREQTWAVTVYATDGQHASPIFTRSVVIGNASPYTAGVVVDPSDPGVGDELTCLHDTPTDAEDDAYDLRYRWTVDGEAQADDGAVLAAGTAARGSRVACQVLLNDGTEVRYSSDPVEILDTPPVVGLVTIEPADADVSTPLSCRPTGVADADGDPVEMAYRWIVEGVQVGVDNRLSAGSATRDQAVTCIVTPSDGYLDGDPVSSETRVIANSPPGAPAVGFARTDLVPGVDATCEVRTPAVDADGDTLAYTWSWAVDGVAAAGTTATYDTNALSPTQTLTCTATADDGTDAGSPASADLVLGAPTTGDLDAADAFVVLTGTTTNASFGKVIDRVDDVDGDGLDELLIGAQRESGSTRGAAYVFTASQLAAGGALTDADASWSWIGHAAGDILGGMRGAAGAGDMDGDGRGDVLVAAPYADTGGVDGGVAYLLYGGLWTSGGDVQTEADARFQGAAGDLLGTRVASGDLDGDGLTDLVATAPYNDTQASQAGVAAVFYGGGSRLSGAYALADADALVTGRGESTQVGWAMDVVGDVDADGYADLGLGLIGDDTNAADAGAAALISGADLGGRDVYDTVAFLLVYGLERSGRFGYDIHGLGDLDQDGVDDVAIGAYTADEGGTDGGRVRVFYGTAGMNRQADDDDADLTIRSTEAGAQLGASLYGGFDFDQDGLFDLLAGAPRASSGPGGSAAGAAHLFLGRDASTWATDADASLTITGTAASDWLGDEIAAAFDLGGDGYQDLAIGAQGADAGASGGGAVYVFEGP